MEAKIIFYHQDKLNQNEKFKLRRELLGINQKSNYGRYQYKVKGLLDEIPNYRPIRSSIIVSNSKVTSVTKLLSKFNVKIEVLDIKIPKSKLLE